MNEQYPQTDIEFGEDVGINGKTTAGTDVSQAVTINSRHGRITSSNSTLAADTTETITVTNKYSKTTSRILCNVRGGGNAAGALIVSADPSAADGSFTLKVRNVTSATAASAVYVVEFEILNDLN